MLLAGRCEVFHIEQSGPAFAVRDVEDGLVSVAGRVPEAAVREAAGCGSAVISPSEDAPRVAGALTGWSPVRAVLHLPGDTVQPARVPAEGVRPLLPAELESAEDLPEALRSELEIGLRRSVVAAAFAGDRPVSFCYVAAETEGLWDLAIDTLAGFRRWGFAARCASYMLRQMEGSGKRPVWGAEETNAASLGLAERLGFVPVDEVVVFHPPAGGSC
ncbi:MAG: GNAT family N-acetyltransferase [Rubrobacter sp.]|nr:GNAT family N-acetyltransferase [Rubrobacter sp.]